ncbi:MAG: hypothetical protein HY062_17310 [Bacteroidetes bacterium]|nr:hypothetical protein [Bacteroidota bacterium]
MAKKVTIKKSAAKKPAKKAGAKKSKIEILTGKSKNYSLEEALKDALTNAQVMDTDYYKYELTKLEYETGGIAQVHNLIVTLKRTVPQ